MQAGEDDIDECGQVRRLSENPVLDSDISQVKCLSKSEDRGQQRIGGGVSAPDTVQQMNDPGENSLVRTRHRNDRMTERLQFQSKRKNEQYYNGVWTVGPDQVQHA